MGDDYANHQMFAGDNAEQRRDQLLAEIQSFLAEQGYRAVKTDESADRSLAIGPAGRWICVYDSYGNGYDSDISEFENLSRRLSSLAPIVDIHMSDNAAVRFNLYQNGRIIDQFANSPDVGREWESWEEELRFQGKPELWPAVLAPSHFNLRAAWQKTGADQIVAATASVLGWHPELCQAGYTIDYDGIPVYFREHFADDPTDIDGFAECHYGRGRTDK